MPERVSAQTVDAVVQAMHEGRGLRTACKDAGVPVGALLERVSRNRRMRDRLDGAFRTSVAIVEDALFETALKGNATALTMYLCNRAPDRWKPTSALRSEPTQAPERLTPADLLERYRIEDGAAPLSKQAS